MGTTTSGLVTHATLKMIADRLRDRFGAERVLVYGSVAQGTSTEHSDIDLLLVAPTTISVKLPDELLKRRDWS